MNAQRYIRQATRGLWGQQKRDAQAELRGAIEDKIYRYTLLGFSEHDALQAALRDLGNPASIARDLNTVHSLPPILKFGLLAGVTGLLSLQAAAQMPVLRAIPLTLEQRQKWCDLSASRVASLPRNYAEYVQQQIKRLGSRAKAEAECLQLTPSNAQYIRLADFVVALRQAGLTVQDTYMKEGLLTVDFSGNGNAETLDYGPSIQTIGGEPYTTKFMLITTVLNNTRIPVRLSGVKNPVVQLGPVKLQLGTPETPLLITDLLASVITRQLEDEILKVATPNRPQLGVAWTEDDGQRGGVLTRVAGQDDTLYATLSTSSGQSLIPGKEFLVASVHSAANGQISAPPRTLEGLPRRVHTMPELIQAHNRKQQAYLVYRVDISDLRQPKLIAVPGAWK